MNVNRIFDRERPVHWGYAHFEAGAEPDPLPDVIAEGGVAGRQREFEEHLAGECDYTTCPFCLTGGEG